MLLPDAVFDCEGERATNLEIRDLLTKQGNYGPPESSDMIALFEVADRGKRPVADAQLQVVTAVEHRLPYLPLFLFLLHSGTQLSAPSEGRFLLAG